MRTIKMKFFKEKILSIELNMLFKNHFVLDTLKFNPKFLARPQLTSSKTIFSCIHTIHIETRYDIKAFKTNTIGHGGARKDSEKRIGNENGKSITVYSNTKDECVYINNAN